MKKTDYQIKRGSEKLTYTRSVKVNNRDVALNVDVTLNHNKGLYTIQPKITPNLITGDKMLDDATLITFKELSAEAIQDCLEWQEEWNMNNPKDDKGIPIPFPEAEEIIEEEETFVPEPPPIPQEVLDHAIEEVEAEAEAELEKEKVEEPKEEDIAEMVATEEQNEDPLPDWE